jgi:dUTP pyrophosphatase
VKAVPEDQAEQDNLEVRFREAKMLAHEVSGTDRAYMDQKIKVKKLTHKARIPTKGIQGAAGHDLFASINTTIPPGGQEVVPTRIAIGLPHGTYGRIAPRSGLTIKKQINTEAGVIDPDYTGEVKVVLRNLGSEQFLIGQGDRIAQLVVERISTNEWEQVPDLGPTNRGTQGFGSTDEKTILIREISANAFGKMYRRGEQTAILKRTGTKLQAINISTELAIRKKKEEGPAKELRDIIPTRYHKYMSLFEEEDSTTLPARKEGTDHEIELELDKPGAKLPNPTLYSIGPKEIKALNAYIDQNLERGWIRPSKSSVGAGILMVPNKDGSI